MRIVFWCFLWILPVWFWAAPGFAEGTPPSLLLIRHGGAEESLDSPTLLGMASEMVSQDPNFSGEPPARFRGVLLSTLLDALEERESSLILLCEDQYMAHFDTDFVREQGAMLAWEQDGKPISRHRGGPLKVVFRKSGLHPSANAWYVQALIPGKTGDIPLRVVKGKKTWAFSQDAVLQAPGRSREMLPPIPKGYRHLSVYPSKKAVEGFVLADLLGSLELSWETLVLRPFVGRELRLTRGEVENMDFFLFSRKGGNLLRSSCGGPWALWAPVHLHPELAGRLPNPDALFFVREILVE